MGPGGGGGVGMAAHAIDGFIAMVRPRGPQLMGADRIAKAAMKVAVSPVRAIVMLGQRLRHGQTTGNMIDEAARYIAAGRPTMIHDGARAVLVQPRSPVVADGFKRRLQATISAGNANLRMPLQAAAAGTRAEQISTMNRRMGRF